MSAQPRSRATIRCNRELFGVDRQQSWPTEAGQDR